MKNLLKDLSIDEIIKLDMPDQEKLLQFFRPGTSFKVGCLKPYKLFGVANHNKEKVVEEETLTMSVVKIDPDQRLWLVYTDPSGNQFGLSVSAMIQLHKQEVIDIESIL